MQNTPIQMLEKIEAEVHEEFGDQVPSAAQVQVFLEKKYTPRAAEIVASATILALLAFLKANGITLATVSGWVVAAYKHWGGPRCPEPECGRKQVAVDPSTGESVCSQGHRWRP
jgi:hypothetical protein